MSFQITPIPGAFFSVFDTANGKTYFVAAASDLPLLSTLSQAQISTLAEFILSAAGDWIKKPKELRTHDVLAGFIVSRSGTSVKYKIPDSVRNALVALNTAVALQG